MKKNCVLKKTAAVFMLSAVVLSSCEDSRKTPELLPPSFKFDREDASYTVKAGRQLVVSPIYSNAEEAEFFWKEIDGNVISRDSVLLWQSDKCGDRFFSLTVKNDAGDAYGELKISVVPLLLPVISLNVPEGGYVIAEGTELHLVPSLNLSEGIVMEWSVDGKKVADTKDYTFSSDTKGDYNLQFTVTAEDGEDCIEFPVKVVSAGELPFSWSFEQTEYHMSSGRSIMIRILDLKNAEDVEFVWSIGGKEVQRGKAAEYVFTSEKEGEYVLNVAMESGAIRVSQELKVFVAGPEGTYRRPFKGTVAANSVYAYIPAPGQFINEAGLSGTIPATLEDAVKFAEDRFAANGFVSLGGFGGYIVVGFDHSVENDGDYNIRIIGNSFKGSSEPGIVWVMQDENGDGLPNDTWYELKGSEYGTGNEKRGYAVTYFKPTAPSMPVQWVDSEGQTGEIAHLGQFHPQEYYYPMWIDGPSYTLRGTCLPSKTVQNENGMWENGEFDWGYADNFSSIDRLDDSDNYAAAANANHFKISNAVTFDGKPANLQYIDFVKIVCGVNASAGWLGEVSTEVFGVKDYNLIKNTSGSSEDLENGEGVWK